MRPTISFSSLRPCGPPPEFENAPPVSEQWLEECYRRLESRGPDDGSELWLNWVIRLPNRQLEGYIQASVLGQGIGSSAVQAVMDELADVYGVRDFVAVLKASNYR